MTARLCCDSFRRLSASCDRFIPGREFHCSSISHLLLLLRLAHRTLRSRFFQALQSDEIRFRRITRRRFVKQDVIRYCNANGSITAFLNGDPARERLSLVGSFLHDLTPRLARLRQVLDGRIPHLCLNHNQF